jgi:hypothetical protein
LANGGRASSSRPLHLGDIRQAKRQTLKVTNVEPLFELGASASEMMMKGLAMFQDATRSGRCFAQDRRRP